MVTAAPGLWFLLVFPSFYTPFGGGGFVVVVGPCSMFSPFFSLLFTPLAAVSKKEGRRARATIKRKQLLKRGSGMRDMRVFVVGPSVFTLKRGRGQFGLLHF